MNVRKIFSQHHKQIKNKAPDTAKLHDHLRTVSSQHWPERSDRRRKITWPSIIHLSQCLDGISKPVSNSVLRKRAE